MTINSRLRIVSKGNVVNVKSAVKYVSDRFSYTPDPTLFDYWTIMSSDQGQMLGDCDDFAITTIWKICDNNIFKFIINVLILHRYRVYFSRTPAGQRHAVGYAEGMYFDNWSREALPKAEFLQKTKHKIYFFFPSPMLILPLVLGAILKVVRKF